MTNQIFHARLLVVQAEAALVLVEAKHGGSFAALPGTLGVAQVQHGVCLVLAAEARLFFACMSVHRSSSTPAGWQ